MLQSIWCWFSVLVCPKASNTLSGLLGLQTIYIQNWHSRSEKMALNQLLHRLDALTISQILFPLSHIWPLQFLWSLLFSTSAHKLRLQKEVFSVGLPAVTAGVPVLHAHALGREAVHGCKRVH